MKTLVTIFMFCTLWLNVMSQAPQKMSYQAVVRDAGGTLVTDHTVSMKISILQGSPTGTVVFQERCNPNPQTNANGLVSIDIGTGIPVTGTFSGINWSTGPYYLKTETDPAGGTNYFISGTSQLLSVPYALFAKTAGNGFSGNYYDLTNKPVLFSGSYYDLTNKPVLFDGAWTNITGKPAFATVATTGSYNDLTNKPVTFDGSWINITGKPTTTSGYGITDAVTLTGNQAIAGIKTFSNDISVNVLTIGKGNNAISSNTAIGNSVLYSNTTGYDNTANGYRALYYNTEGYRNTANGYRALFSNTTGYRNTADGYHALYSNITGNNNTANGCGALDSNTTGYENTANGSDALYSNTTGYQNTANGLNALYSNMDGNNNTANGYHALISNTTGNRNSANGSFSLYSNTTGDNNIAIGYYASKYNTSGNNNIAIGHYSFNGNSTGSSNTSVGSYSDVTSYNLTNATAIGNQAKVNASNKVRIGNSSVTVIEGQVSWSVGSDKRLKENIRYSDEPGLEFVNSLKTATFTYKDDPNTRHHNGLIAQDVRESLNQLGLDFSGIIENDNEEKILNLSYAEFVIPLINSVKELTKKNQEQQKQLDDLKALVSNLIANQNRSDNK